MENNTMQTEQNNQPKDNNKQSLKYIIISAIALLIAVASYFIFKQKNDPNVTPKITKTDSILKKNDSLNRKINADSLTTKIHEEGDEEGETYGNFVYVGKGQVLGEKQLKFGDVVYVDYQKSGEGKKIVYLENPYEKINLPTYNINSDNLIDESTFESYKKNFSLVPFTSLPSSVKDLILDNHYSNGNDYSITQNEERAKSTICYGDFDGDNSKDFAILLDNNEKQISRLLVICTNSATKKPYIGFAENYNDKMRINSFKKGASILIDSEMQSADMDGIILKGEDLKLAIVYEKNLQKFKTFYQE